MKINIENSCENDSYLHKIKLKIGKSFKTDGEVNSKDNKNEKNDQILQTDINFNLSTNNLTPRNSNRIDEIPLSSRESQNIFNSQSFINTQMDTQTSPKSKFKIINDTSNNLEKDQIIDKYEKKISEYLKSNSKRKFNYSTSNNSNIDIKLSKTFIINYNNSVYENLFTESQNNFRCSQNQQERIGTTNFTISINDDTKQIIKNKNKNIKILQFKNKLKNVPKLSKENKNLSFLKLIVTNQKFWRYYKNKNRLISKFKIHPINITKIIRNKKNEYQNIIKIINIQNIIRKYLNKKFDNIYENLNENILNKNTEDYYTNTEVKLKHLKINEGGPLKLIIDNENKLNNEISMRNNLEHSEKLLKDENKNSNIKLINKNESLIEEENEIMDKIISSRSIIKNKDKVNYDSLKKYCLIENNVINTERKLSLPNTKSITITNKNFNYKKTKYVFKNNVFNMMRKK